MIKIHCTNSDGFYSHSIELENIKELKSFQHTEDLPDIDCSQTLYYKNGWNIINKKPTEYHFFDGDKWYIPQSEIDNILKQLESKINAETDTKILNGFIYQGKKFYLSLENQFNYKSAYDARAVLPYPFAIKGKSEFVTFADAAELEAFYIAGFAYVQQCISEGWIAKENLKTKTIQELINLL